MSGLLAVFHDEGRAAERGPTWRVAEAKRVKMAWRGCDMEWHQVELDPATSAALSRYQTALLVHPGCAEAHNNLGECGCRGPEARPCAVARPAAPCPSCAMPCGVMLCPAMRCHAHSMPRANHAMPRTQCPVMPCRAMPQSCHAMTENGISKGHEGSSLTHHLCRCSPWPLLPPQACCTAKWATWSAPCSATRRR